METSTYCWGGHLAAFNESGCGGATKGPCHRAERPNGHGGHAVLSMVWNGVYSPDNIHVCIVYIYIYIHIIYINTYIHKYIYIYIHMYKYAHRPPQDRIFHMFFLPCFLPLDLTCSWCMHQKNTRQSNFLMFPCAYKRQGSNMITISLLTFWCARWRI